MKGTTKRKYNDGRGSSGSAPKRQKYNVPVKSAEEIASEQAALLEDKSPFVENTHGADLKREVELYALLASEDAAERLEAAGVVITGLLGDGEHTKATPAVLKRHLERRLFRGLASGRKGARLGYSLVLVEVITAILREREGVEAELYKGLGFEDLLAILLAKTKPEGDLSGQEEKDHALGLLFGLQCFVRARVVGSGHEERWTLLLERLLDLSKKKTWMREECGWVVVEALAQLEQKQAEQTLALYQDAGLGMTPEGVGIWITARKRWPSMKFPNKPWGQNGNPLEHLKSLALALKESSSAKEQDQAKATGNWNPQLHFVWSMVLEQYAPSLADKKSKQAVTDFKSFWKVAVDGQSL